MMKLLSALMLSAGVTVVATAPGGATPVETGCPSGFEHVAVADILAIDRDYMRPEVIDAEGNNDGFICALALPEAFRESLARRIGQEPAVPVIFLFSENDSPAAR